ncbi:unnamed protein product, partial [Discosporangium mesarthrocarpum]
MKATRRRSRPRPLSQGANEGHTRRKNDTRFGNREGGGTNFGSEERFLWQKPQYASDALYNVPSGLVDRPFSFGFSTREDWRKILENLKDLHNPNAGPGNYRVGNEHELLSDCPSRRDITFGQSVRGGMALSTASPGVLYNVEGVLRTGPDKGRIFPGFNLDSRKPLADNLNSTTSAMYSPQLPKGGRGAVYFGSKEQSR